MTATTLNLRYIDNVGFNADNGGRGFHLPTAMVIRGDGRIFVSSRSSLNQLVIVGIQMVSQNHDFYGQIGRHGRAPGDMMGPTALALDSDDNLYLADEFLQRITVYDRDGDVVTTWGKKGSGDGEFNAPSGMAFDRDDNLLLVDHMNNRVQRLAKDGTYISQWGSFGDGDGEFNLPWGITQDRDANVYIADWRNDRIQKFTPDGEFIAKYGAPGTGDGQLNRPSDVAVDSEGNMWVADWGNQRLQVLDSEGNFLAKARGEADLSVWSQEYMSAQKDEERARSFYVPVFEVDTDDINEESARIEPYFWDPVAVAMDDEGRGYVLETGRHRFQIYELA